MGGTYSHDVECSGCRKLTIKGERFICRECKPAKSFNLCGICYNNAKVLHFDHIFDKMIEPNVIADSALTRDSKAVQSIETPAPLGCGRVEFLEQRRQQLSEIKKATNILVFGERGVGKTAFLNTFWSGFQDVKQTDYKFADVHGRDLSHKTAMIRCHAIDEKHPVRVWDTWGWVRDGEFINDGVFPFLLNGHLSDGFPIADRTTMNGSNPKFVENPSFAQRMHAVVVLTEPNRSEQYNEQVRRFLAILAQLHIPYVMVINKVDLADKTLDKEPEKMYESLKVQALIASWRDMFKVDARDVFPFKGYTWERNRKLFLEQLALDIVFSATRQAEIFMTKAQTYRAAKAN